MCKNDNQNSEFYLKWWPNPHRYIMFSGEISMSDNLMVSSWRVKPLCSPVNSSFSWLKSLWNHQLTCHVHQQHISPTVPPDFGRKPPLADWKDAPQHPIGPQKKILWGMARTILEKSLAIWCYNLSISIGYFLQIIEDPLEEAQFNYDFSYGISNSITGLSVVISMLRIYDDSYKTWRMGTYIYIYIQEADHW